MNFLFLTLFGIYTAFLAFLSYRYLLKRSNKYVMKKANINAVRWGSQTKPVVGGMVFFAIFLFSFINSFLFSGAKSSSIDIKLIAIIITVTLAFLMGLGDDMINTSHYFKFIVQILCSFILIYFGFVINVSPYAAINYIITGLWVVGIMNSFNMLDNMDAITAPVSLSILGGIFCLNLLFHNSFDDFYFFIITGTSAALISFLFYNWHPAKIYMGDNGSQFLGSLLAILGIVFFWNMNSNDTCYCYNTKQLITVTLAFLVPLCDTTTVTINRLMKGKSPFKGGRDHTTHHLNYLGLSPRSVALILFGINAVSVSLAVVITYAITDWGMGWFYVFTAFALVVFTLLYSTTRISNPKESE